MVLAGIYQYMITSRHCTHPTDLHLGVDDPPWLIHSSPVIHLKVQPCCGQIHHTGIHQVRQHPVNFRKRLQNKSGQPVTERSSRKCSTKIVYYIVGQNKIIIIFAIISPWKSVVTHLNNLDCLLPKSALCQV